MGRRIFSPIHEKCRILAAQALNLRAFIREYNLAGRRSRDDLILYANRGRRPAELASDVRLQGEERIKTNIGEEAPEVHVLMRAANPVHSAMALHQTHRIPWEVVVDDVAALLQIHAFGQYVGRD